MMIDIANIIIGAVVGLLTGCISSWLVSKKFEEKAARLNQERQFEEEKQQLHSFLNHVSDDLKLLEQSTDMGHLVWTIGCRPFCNNLVNLKDSDSNLLNQIDRIIEEIHNFCFASHGLYFSEDARAKIAKWMAELSLLSQGVKFISNPCGKK